MINMVKVLTTPVLDFSALLDARIHYKGDVFKENYNALMITVPLSYDGTVDPKFIRFINLYPDEIKIIIVVYDSDDDVDVSNLPKDKLVLIDINNYTQEDIDKINKMIKEALKQVNK